MNREVLDTYCERAILWLVLAILVFGPVAAGGVHTPTFLVIQTLTVLVMLLWGFRLWLKPRPKLLWPPICWAVLAFTAYAIARYFTAELEYPARYEVTRVVIYAFLFFVILNNLHRQEHMQMITLTLIFLAMAISFYAIYQFVTNSDRVWMLTKPYKHRGSGTYISPNNLAGFLEMILPMSLAWMLVSRVKPVVKVFIGYAAVVTLAGIGVTVSRGSWVATALALAVFFGFLLTHRTYRLPAIALLALLVGIGLYSVPRTQFFKARWKEITANQQLNDSARFDLWKPAVRLWRENIWWGIGPNHFNFRFRAFRPQTEQMQPDRVHNDYLNTLTDWGIVGVVLVASAWVLLYAGIFKTWRFVRGIPSDLGGGNSNKFAVVLGTSIGLLAILVHSTVDFNMSVPANAILAVALMAILTGCLRFTTDRYWFTARTGSKVLATLLLLVGAGALGWQGVRSAREYVWLKRARQAPDLASASAAFEKALAIEPGNFQTTYKNAEALRKFSQEKDGDEALATRAIEWFDRGIKLNPYDGYNYLGRGICLDWPLDRKNESQPSFDRAVELDPNGYFTAAYVGWHYFQLGDYPAAKVWLERSKRLDANNVLADSYLGFASQRLLETAAGPSLRELHGP
jgi:O-antigen ligase